MYFQTIGIFQLVGFDKKVFNFHGPGVKLSILLFSQNPVARVRLYSIQVNKNLLYEKVGGI